MEGARRKHRELKFRVGCGVAISANEFSIAVFPGSTTQATFVELLRDCVRAKGIKVELEECVFMVDVVDGKGARIGLPDLMHVSSEDVVTIEPPHRKSTRSTRPREGETSPPFD
uniref:Uncharacterized protein n=1 Tax=Chloropicon roscoffensis TaxID=1461544 RepID=A0A7S3C7F1_9CHLO|mmetsp:Transcript_10437/g.31941  ORF Transcript_10437/g.31941 Transcript_10437/m.31941 type:complete len:114 (+) Transcript_10437:105-446(+)